jgi:hypothetical protein
MTSCPGDQAAPVSHGPGIRAGCAEAVTSGGRFRSFISTIERFVTGVLILPTLLV